MSRARTWSVRLSVDELNASICLIESDEDLASWTRGLMRGLNGGDAKSGASDAYSEGWELGAGAREKADALRAECAETGRIGGSKRVANAQANASPVASPNASPNAQPFGQPERRTNNEEPITKNKERKASAPKVAFSPSMFDAMIPEALAKSEGFVVKWTAWVASRHNRRKPISELAAKEQLAKLAGFGVAGAIESLRQSIEGDWQGIFPPKVAAQAPFTPPAAARQTELAGQPNRNIPISMRWQS